jgi:hypothetical protein
MPTRQEITYELASERRLCCHGSLAARKLLIGRRRIHDRTCGVAVNDRPGEYHLATGHDRGSFDYFDDPVIYNDVATGHDRGSDRHQSLAV